MAGKPKGVITPAVALLLIKPAVEAELAYLEAVEKLAGAIGASLEDTIGGLSAYVSSLDKISDVTEDSAMTLIEDIKNPGESDT